MPTSLITQRVLSFFFSGNVFNLFTLNYEQNCKEKVKHFTELESKILDQDDELKQYKLLVRKQQKQIKQLENSVSDLVIFNLFEQNGSFRSFSISQFLRKYRTIGYVKHF